MGAFCIIATGREGHVFWDMNHRILKYYVLEFMKYMKFEKQAMNKLLEHLSN